MSTPDPSLSDEHLPASSAAEPAAAPRDATADESPDQSSADTSSGEPSPGEASASAAAADALFAGDPLAPLRQELSAANDRALRAAAELENFRRRMRREQEEERRFALVPLLEDLLPVVDNLERAVQAGEAAGGSAGWLEGVKLVAAQLHDVLRRHHCAPIAALGEAFDPNVHQAILQQPSAEHPAGTVLLVSQTGYLLHDRVLRPAQVIVSSGPPADDAPTAGEA